MKILLFSLMALVLGACSEGSDTVEVGNRTTMEVKKVFDAGEVVKGELIRAKFVVTNTGKYPLVIADVTASCSCTVADFPKDPIQPGKKGTIVATVDTDKTPSKVDKNINVTANTTPSVTQLKIKGKVIAK